MLIQHLSELKHPSTYNTILTNWLAMILYRLRMASMSVLASWKLSLGELVKRDRSGVRRLCGMNCISNLFGQPVVFLEVI